MDSKVPVRRRKQVLRRLALAGVVLVLLAPTVGLTAQGNTQTAHKLGITFRGWIVSETFFGTTINERLRVLGEVENLTDRPFQDLSFRVILYDAEGHVLNMKDRDLFGNEIKSPLYYLPPYGKAPFEVIFWRDFKLTKKIEVEVSWKPFNFVYALLNAKPWRWAQILDSSLIKEDNGEVTVVGIVKSSGGHGDVNVVVTLYNDAGEAVGIGGRRLSNEEFWDKEEQFFRITIEPVDSVADYSVQAESGL